MILRSFRNYVAGKAYPVAIGVDVFEYLPLLVHDPAIVLALGHLLPPAIELLDFEAFGHDLPELVLPVVLELPFPSDVLFGLLKCIFVHLVLVGSGCPFPLLLEVLVDLVVLVDLGVDLVDFALAQLLDFVVALT